MNEIYVAWIQDLTDNIDKCGPYGQILTNHISRFKEEKDLNNKNINQSLVKDLVDELEGIYAHTIKIINDAKSEEAKSKKTKPEDAEPEL